MSLSLKFRAKKSGFVTKKHSNFIKLYFSLPMEEKKNQEEYYTIMLIIRDGSQEAKCRRFCIRNNLWIINLKFIRCENLENDLVFLL